MPVVKPLPTAWLSCENMTSRLNMFNPLPARGTMRVPSLRADDPERSMLLNNSNAWELSLAMKELLGEACALKREWEAWSLNGESSFIDHEGSWLIENFPNSDLYSIEDDPPDTQLQGLILRGPQGKYLKINSRNEGIEISLGWRGRYSFALQTAFLDSYSQIGSLSYDIIFNNKGLLGLRHFMKMKSKPLLELACELADTIGRSSHYHGAGHSPDKLVKNIGPSFDPNINISSAQEVSLHGPSGKTVPVFAISGEESSADEGFLNVRLRPNRPYRSLMPLPGKLLRFFRGARIWASKYPDRRSHH